MASGSQNMTTYNARTVTGSNSAASPAGALLLSGAGRADDATGDTWIFLDSASGTSTPWGIKHDQTDNKIHIYGNDIDSAWTRMNTGDTYILGKVGIGYDPETSGNSYKLYVNGTSNLNGATFINGTLTTAAAITAAYSSAHLYLKNTQWIKGTIPSSQSWSAVEYVSNDSSNNRIALLETTLDTSGNSQFNILLVPNVANSTSWSGIVLKKTSDDVLTVSIAGSTSVTGSISASTNITAGTYILAGTYLQARNHIYLDTGHFYMKYNNTWYSVLHNHGNGNISVEAASGGLYIGYSNTTLVNWMDGRMQLKDGCLSIFPNNSSYREGIRIHATGSWSNITLCGNDNTGDSGTSANSWFIGNNNGNFYITRYGSNSSGADAQRSEFSSVNNQWRLRSYVQAHKSGIYRSGLHIYGPTYGNTAADMASGTAGLFSWNDGGPQITFDTNATPGRGQAGALIFTDNDTAGTGVSWHFVSNQGDWNVTSKRFHARTSISIGTNLPDISYNLYVNGSTYFNGNTTHNGIDYFANGTTYYINNSAVAYLNDLRSDKVRLVDNWIGFYQNGNASDNRYGYISVDADRMYFRKENSTANLSYYFDFGSTVQAPTFRAGNDNATYSVDRCKVYAANGVVGILASTNRGLYEFTDGKWIVYLQHSDDTVRFGYNAYVYQATRASYVLDRTNSTATYSNYGAAGLAASAISWLTCWNGYELRAISKAEMANAVDSAHKWVRLAGDTMTGLLKITTNSNTVTIGSQNSGWCHFTNSANISFYFNKSVHVDGSIYVYNSTHHLDSTAIYAYRWRTTNLELAELDANRMGLCNHGQGTAKGLNVGSLLVSNAWADSSKVPTNGIYCKGGAVFQTNITNLTGYIKGEGDSYTNHAIKLGHNGDDVCIFYEYGGLWRFYTSSSGSNTQRAYIDSQGVHSAVWNDFAEYRAATTEEPGRVVISHQSGQMQLASQRLQPSGHVISDTFGCSVGESDKAKSPIAVAGRVLVYPYQNRNNYNIGDAVCTAPNGTVDIMTREEIIKYPDRIIGIVDEIPNYDVWQEKLTLDDANGEYKPIQVKGRIWIYVR